MASSFFFFFGASILQYLGSHSPATTVRSDFGSWPSVNSCCRHHLFAFARAGVCWRNWTDTAEGTKSSRSTRTYGAAVIDVGDNRRWFIRTSSRFWNRGIVLRWLWVHYIFFIDSCMIYSCLPLFTYCCCTNYRSPLFDRIDYYNHELIGEVCACVCSVKANSSALTVLDVLGSTAGRHICRCYCCLIIRWERYIGMTKDMHRNLWLLHASVLAFVQSEAERKVTDPGDGITNTRIIFEGSGALEEGKKWQSLQLWERWGADV